MIMNPLPSRRTVLKAGGVLAGGAALAGALPGQASATHVPRFSLLTPATAVAARTDRRPIAGGLYDSVARSTFISWGGVNEDSYVQAYDHRTGAWSAPRFVVGGRGDSHNYPTMVQARDGHLLVVVGMHNGETVVARSARPHTADGAWDARVVPAGAAASYPMPFRSASGDLFVFFRETTRTLDPTVPSDTRPLLYMRSRDNGLTWQSSTELTGARFALGSTDRADNLNEIYMGQLRYRPGRHGRPERVHLVWTLAGGGPGQHLHDWFHKDIHYAAFDPNTLHFHSASGRDLGTQLDDADQEQHCKVIVTPFVRPGGMKAPDYIQLVGTLAGGPRPPPPCGGQGAGPTPHHLAVRHVVLRRRQPVATQLRLDLDRAGVADHRGGDRPAYQGDGAGRADHLAGVRDQGRSAQHRDLPVDAWQVVASGDGDRHAEAGAADRADHRVP